jgi:hypothetical protein
VDDDAGNLPLAIALLGLAAVALFFMARPWPQTAAGPIKPGAYVVDVLLGKPPPAGPATFSPGEVRLTEAGLTAILALWAAGKAGSALGGIAGAAGAGGGILGKLWGWIKGLGSDVGPAAGDAAAAAGEAV